MKITEGEITKELVTFLDQHGMYHDFIEWIEARGYEKSEVESILEEIDENN